MRKFHPRVDSQKLVSDYQHEGSGELQAVAELATSCNHTMARLAPWCDSDGRCKQLLSRKVWVAVYYRLTAVV